MAGVTTRGEGRGVTSQYSAALLYNGLGHYDKALAAAEQVCEYDDIGVLGWSLTELIEAAVRSGQPARASDHSSDFRDDPRQRHRLGAWRRGTLTCPAEHGGDRREALPGGDRAARAHSHAPGRGRARLLYGEWLRRENRRRDARVELRTAYDQLTTMGIEAFAERARRELLATGDTVRKRSVETASRAHRPGGLHRPARRRRP